MKAKRRIPAITCGFLCKPVFCGSAHVSRWASWAPVFFLRRIPSSTSTVLEERGPDQGCSLACPFLCSDVNVIVAVIFSFAFISGCYCNRIWPSSSDARNCVLLRFPAAPRHETRHTLEGSLICALQPLICYKLKWSTGLYSDILHRIVLQFGNNCGKYGRTDT